ncbi:MAG: IS110 family transposase [Anaerolineae bacterium]|nr:IS110 family transposase [Anaerolineae bacterium]
MLYIGIDIHKRAHEVVILDNSGKQLGRSFKIHNTYPDLQQLFERIQKVNPFNESLRFGMEATGHYWLALYSHLQAADMEVVVLNPLRTHAYRARSIRPAKNDRIDARCIAEIIHTAPESDYQISDEDMLGLRQLTRLRVQLVDLVSDQKRRLLALLDHVFPEFESLFREKYCKSALRLLQMYPTPKDIVEVDTAELGKLIAQTSRKRRYANQKAAAIKEAAANSFGIRMAQKANSIQIKLLASQILYLEAQQNDLDQEIRAYVDQIPNYLATIPGIGDILAATILGEIGDVHRFSNAKALVAYAGLDPSVNQSGAFIGRRAHISKRGSTHLRRAIWLASAAATRFDPALKARLKKKMDEGKPYHVALGAVANKLLHIIYAVLRDNQPYYSPIEKHKTSIAA